MENCWNEIKCRRIKWELKIDNGSNKKNYELKFNY